MFILETVDSVFVFQIESINICIQFANIEFGSELIKKVFSIDLFV